MSRLMASIVVLLLCLPLALTGCEGHNDDRQYKLPGEIYGVIVKCRKYNREGWDFVCRIVPPNPSQSESQ